MKDSQDIQTCHAQRRGVNWSDWRDCSQVENYGRGQTANFWRTRPDRIPTAWCQGIAAREIEPNEYMRLLARVVGRGMLN